MAPFFGNSHRLLWKMVHLESFRVDLAIQNGDFPRLCYVRLSEDFPFWVLVSPSNVVLS